LWQNASGIAPAKYGFRTLYFATKGAIPPVSLSIQFLRCEM
jgi:hypothetical protein